MLSAVLFMAMIIAFLYVQAASSTRCVFYDVGANGGCLLHLRILLYVSVVNFNSLVHKFVALPHQL